MTVFGIFWLLCQGFIALLLFFLVLGIWDHTWKFLSRLGTKNPVNNAKRDYDNPMYEKNVVNMTWDDFQKLDHSKQKFEFVRVVPQTAAQRKTALEQAKQVVADRKKAGILKHPNITSL